jgi:hypothetical protein
MKLPQTGGCLCVEQSVQRGWNSRLQYTGDFESLSEALAAIEVAYPAVEPVEGSFLVSTHESGIPRDISGKAEGGGYVVSPAASRRPDR